MEWEQGRQLKEFNSIYREFDRIYHEIARHLGMSDSAFLVFYAIMELGDGCLQKEIAMSYSTSKQTINSAVRNLEAAGYLCLRRGKRRDMHIYLTEAGAKMAREKIGPVLELENSIFQEMTLEEGNQLLGLTRRYVTILRDKANRFYGLSDTSSGRPEEG